MNASARTAVVALALAGLVAAVVAVSRTPDPPPPPTVARVAAAPTVKRTPRVRAGAEPSPELLTDEPTSEVVPDATDAPPAPDAKAAPRVDLVPLALRWLKDHQSPDGSWHDPATTGLALLAFLGGGETHQSGTYRETVKNGLKHLCEVQDADGCLAPRDAAHRLRDHAIAGLALVEAYGMTSARFFKEPAQRAVAFAMKTRTPSSGWMRPDGRLDFEATVWMSMLVKSAKLSELDVDTTALADAVTAIDQVTDHATGRVVAPDTGLSDEGATAMGMFVRCMAGHLPDDDDVLRRGAELLSAKPPAWVDGRLADPAAWYFGTLVMSRLYHDRWKPWADAMVAVMDRAATADDRGDRRGSWDPPDASASDQDRVRSTAYALFGIHTAFYGYKIWVK